MCSGMLLVVLAPATLSSSLECEPAPAPAVIIGFGVASFDEESSAAAAAMGFDGFSSADFMVLSAAESETGPAEGDDGGGSA